MVVERLMRTWIVLLCLAAVTAFAQQGPDALPNGQPTLKTRTELPPPPEAKPYNRPKHIWVVPAGTKIPIQLRQPISTKNGKVGDSIYAQTNFPVIVKDQVVIPSGTYVEGVIDRVKRAGRIKGTAELAFHLTRLIYPNGYMVDMAAAIEQVPGDDNAQMKEPGTVKHNPEKGKDLERIGRNASEGAAIGGVAGVAIHPTAGGFGAGGLTGIAAGTMIGLLARGSDVRFETGTIVDVALNRPIGLDADKVMRPTTVPAYYPMQQPPVIMVPPQRQ